MSNVPEALRPTNESGGQNQNSSRKTTAGEISPGAQGSRAVNWKSGSFDSGNARGNKAKPIAINGRSNVLSVVFLADGEHLVGGEMEGKIRCWGMKDGVEVGTPMDAGSPVRNIAVSQDGKWIVSGTKGGQVTVWNAETHKKLTGFNAHSREVNALDVSPDATRIATGSNGSTACVWSLSTGKRLLGPWKHDHGGVVAAKFSPDGRLIATATWNRESVRVYDAHNGRLLFDAAIKVNSILNGSVAWASDGKQLFALSDDGNIHRLDVSTGTILSKWAIHDTEKATCIALNGTLIVASAGSSVSFWDIAKQEQIGAVIKHTHNVLSMALSEKYDLAAGGDATISLRTLCDILPSPFTSNEIVNFEKSIEELRIQLSESQQACQEKDSLIQTLHEQEERSSNSAAQLEKLNHELRDELAKSRRAADEAIGSLRSDLQTREVGLKQQIEGRETIIRQLREQHAASEDTVIREKNNLAQTIDSLRAASESSSNKIISLEQTNQQLGVALAESQRAAEEQKNSLVETVELLQSDLREQETGSNTHIGHLEKTIHDLRDQIATSQRTARVEQDRLSETIDSLHAKLRAQSESSNNEIARLSRIIRAHEQKHHCESLYTQGRLHDAAQLILEMTASEDVKTDELLSGWIAEFTQRCVIALEKVGDEASNAKERDTAYAAALSLGPLTPDTLLAKWASTMLIDCSAHEALNAAVKVKVARFLVCRAICDVLERDGRLTEAMECFRQMQNEIQDDASTREDQVEWERGFRERCIEKFVKFGDSARDAGRHDEAIGHYSDALSLNPTNHNEILFKHSNELIELNPSSHTGYKEKHTALHGMARYGEAFEAFRTMLSKIEESSDPQVCELRHQYLDITPLIQKSAQQTTSHMPRVLVDTTTGRLRDKMQQAAAFEELPIYNELRSSMITRMQLDRARIQKEIKIFYRYVMFSHRWENGEPLFQTVHNISIYDLQPSPPNMKLQTLCKTSSTLGFRWVWSDTCCIDKKDNVVLQESLVAMFRWYRGSSLTLVYLRGIWSHSQRSGDLRRSVWNTRVWTYQEYIAADKVQFYTEDWKPYLELDTFNHKESPTIISEMEQVSGVSARELAALGPGLDRVREKLFLASTRQTTLIEDIAYSLLGIFNASIPVIYGEGNRAVGRLLECILTGSGDVTILAWTGRAGGYNSCLPVDLTVYGEVVPPHVPLPIEPCEMDDMVTALRSSSLDLSSASELYKQLNKLPLPSVAHSRLQLAGIVFPVTKLAHAEPDVTSGIQIYRATTAALEDVEFKTSEDLSGMDDFLFIHPWISPLLDQEFSRRAVGLDDTTRTLRLVARLRQPFGALLLAPLSRVQYKRVATDSLIMICIREETELTELIEGIRTVDIQ